MMGSNDPISETSSMPIERNGGEHERPLDNQKASNITGVDDADKESSTPQQDPAVAKEKEDVLETGVEEAKKKRHSSSSSSSSSASSSTTKATKADKRSNSDDDDDDEDDDDKDADHLEIQLGFAEPISTSQPLLFEDPDWHDWDGGKIGGKPIWLNTRDLPARQDLDCPSCGDPLTFILQIYCPLDDASAFHRALFVFCCQKTACKGPGCAKAFRCQLSRDNPFYAYDPPKRKKAKKADLPRQLLAIKTCHLCGQRGDKICSGCRSVSYCTRKHQKEAWQAGHKLQCKGGCCSDAKEEANDAAGGGTEESKSSPVRMMKDEIHDVRSVFRQYEIVVEEEKPQDLKKKTPEQRQRDDEMLLKKYKDVYVEEADEDAKLGQRDLDKASGANSAVKDKQTLRFLVMVGAEPEQILRYARWQEQAPLWVSSDDQPKPSDIPPCPHCGAKRAFEFQVMPQLLHYLRVDSNAQFPTTPGDVCRLGAMDWGTLAVYTCTRSCQGEKRKEGGYIEEMVWRQKPLE